MPYEVKMPQLGMNQDSAVIVSWLKASGDQVATGDPIFEVETDKATMEVEAAMDGFLAGIVAKEGDDVPVGDLIALIVENEEDIEKHNSAEPAAAAPEPLPLAMSDVQPDPSPDPEPAPAAHPAKPKLDSRGVLASPLAKRLASERGIDLAALRTQGATEPIHTADLSTAQSRDQSHLSANVDGSAFDALLSRSDDADRVMLMAAFAAGGWRKVFDMDDVAIAVLEPDGTMKLHSNPDQRGAGLAETPALRLIDLCDTRLNSYTPAGGGLTLAIARDDNTYALTLTFSETALPLPQAIAVLDAIAARIEDPIRQLL